MVLHYYRKKPRSLEVQHLTTLYVSLTYRRRQMQKRRPHLQCIPVSEDEVSKLVEEALGKV